MAVIFSDVTKFEIPEGEVNSFAVNGQAVDWSPAPAGETWVINQTPTNNPAISGYYFDVNYSVDGTSYSRIAFRYIPVAGGKFYIQDDLSSTKKLFYSTPDGWTTSRTFIFSQPVTDTRLLAWLQANAVKKCTDLPSAYQQVDYISSYHTDNLERYINTGLTFNDVKLVFDMEIAYKASSGWEFGANSASGEELLFGTCYLNGTSGSFSYDKDIRYKVEMQTTSGNAYLNINGQQIITSTNSPNNKKIYLFGLISGASSQTVDAFRDHKYYSWEVYNSSGTLLQKFIPCYRKSDTEIGFYDTVAKVFHPNDGTGTFLKGSDIG